MNEKLIVGIGNRLLEERERLGLNKGQMAALAGCVISTYTNYEEGKREPSATFLINISTNANVDLLYVLTGLKADNVATTNEEASLLQCYRLLESRPRLAVNRLLSTLSGILEVESKTTNEFKVEEESPKYETHNEFINKQPELLAAEPTPTTKRKSLKM